jgi:hypothetical protein
MMSDTKVVKNRKPPAAGKGRPKGALNKVTRGFRETVNELLEGNADNVSKWLETVAKGDGDQLKPDPKGALDILSKLAEYATPKLARSEHVGDNGGPLVIEIVRFGKD